jgi:predicted nucleotidyltransferase component of viral defense system
MADAPKNRAASVKQRLLNMARTQGRGFDILLVRFVLERLLFRLSRSAYRDRYILKGGMLVTQWLDHDNRETRDADFLGFGESDAETIKAIFAEIMSITSDDGLDFDTSALTATAIRDEMEYGGIRLKTSAYLERTRIPVTLDIAFGDALVDAAQSIDYPSLLDMERPSIRAYPPAQVIAEKFQAVVALGLANGRMKDFYSGPFPRPCRSRKRRSTPQLPPHSSEGQRPSQPNDPSAYLQQWRKTNKHNAVGVPMSSPSNSLCRIMPKSSTISGPCSRRVAHDYLT